MITTRYCARVFPHHHRRVTAQTLRVTKLCRSPGQTPDSDCLLWGLNIQFGLDQRVFGCPVGSCCDLVLAGESVEDWSSVDLVVDEVDHVWGLGRGLGRCALPERSVWPRLVEMVQVCGEDLP
jgi:hypothetical protein